MANVLVFAVYIWRKFHRGLELSEVIGIFLSSYGAVIGICLAIQLMICRNLDLRAFHEYWIYFVLGALVFVWISVEHIAKIFRKKLRQQESTGATE